MRDPMDNVSRSSLSGRRIASKEVMTSSEAIQKRLDLYSEGSEGDFLVMPLETIKEDEGSKKWGIAFGPLSSPHEAIWSYVPYDSGGGGVWVMRMNNPSPENKVKFIESCLGEGTRFYGLSRWSKDLESADWRGYPKVSQVQKRIDSFFEGLGEEQRRYVVHTYVRETENFETGEVERTHGSFAFGPTENPSLWHCEAFGEWLRIELDPSEWASHIETMFGGTAHFRGPGRRISTLVDRGYTGVPKVLNSAPPWSVRALKKSTPWYCFWPTWLFIATPILMGIGYFVDSLPSEAEERAGAEAAWVEWSQHFGLNDKSLCRWVRDRVICHVGPQGQTPREVHCYPFSGCQVMP